MEDHPHDSGDRRAARPAAGRLPLAAAIALAFAIPATVSAAAGRTSEIARTGGALADIDGSFSSFSLPTINNVNTVLFRARLTGTSDGAASDSGIYRFFHASVGGPAPTINSGVQEVVREGQTLNLAGGDLVAGDLFLAATHLENSPVVGIAAPVIGWFSSIALELPVTGGLENGDSAIIVEQVDRTFEVVAREGDAVTVVPDDDAVYGDLRGFNLFGIGGNRNVGFFAAMNETTLGSADNTALFRFAPVAGPGDDSVRVVAREGDGLGGVFAPTMSDAGGIAFLAGLEVGNAAGPTGLARVLPGALGFAILVEEGDAVPDDSGIFEQLGEVRINNAGHLAFTALLDDTPGIDGSTTADDSGVYLHNGLAVRELVREGDPVPDGDGRFGRFQDAFSGAVPRPVFNDRDEVAFLTRLTHTAAERDNGIYVASPDAVVEVAREGDAIADATFWNFEAPVLNNSGIVAFLTTLAVAPENAGGGPGTDLGFDNPPGDDEPPFGPGDGEGGALPLLQTALVMSDGIDFAIVARQGETLPGGTLLDIEFNNEWRGDVNGLSDSGVIVYRARYDDFSTAINSWRPDIGWRHAGDGSWDDAGNWFLGLMPNAELDIVLDPAADTTVTGPAADTTVRSLALGHGAGPARLLLGSGALTTLEGLAIGANGELAGGGTLGGVVHNDGLVSVAAGTLLNVTGDIVNAASIALGDGATLAFAGLYAGPGEITGNGTARFGGGLAPGASPGLLTIAGDAVFEAGNTLVLELAGPARGTGYDAIDVGGMLTLGGVLEVLLTDGHALAPGGFYLLLQAALIDGDFADVVLPTITGLNLALVRTDSTLGLSVQAVPLPPAAWLLAAPLLALARRRRR
ncbi:MAG: hypothetical protein RLW62_04135 [Gammaproteobacteria bacterium]